MLILLFQQTVQLYLYTHRYISTQKKLSDNYKNPILLPKNCRNINSIFDKNTLVSSEYKQIPHPKKTDKK